MAESLPRRQPLLVLVLVALALVLVALVLVAPHVAQRVADPVGDRQRRPQRDVGHRRLQ
jgi:membrane protein implicated in regulation of membrane protease activity